MSAPTQVVVDRSSAPEDRVWRWPGPDTLVAGLLLFLAVIAASLAGLALGSG